MGTRRLVLLVGLVLIFASASSPIMAKEIVNMEFKQAPLVDVFQILGQLGGYNVLVDPTVQGEVTFTLKNLAVEEALDLVTRTTGYRYQLLGNTLVVGSEQRLKSEFGSQDFSFISIEHVDVKAAQGLVALVTPNVKSYVDSEQNLLILYGLTTDLELATRVLKQYDQKTVTTPVPTLAEPAVEEIEEKIVLTVRVEDSVSVDYASTINWFRKDTGETENNQQLTHNFTTSPLKCDNPVILEVDHKMMTDKTHLFEAPAMQFYTTRSDGLLEVSNKDSLTLVTDFVSFDTKIEGKGELILRTIGGKKYGVVYFGDIMYENEKSPIVTKGYYLFEDGTTWEDGELKTGGLLPAPEDVTDRLFDFSKVRQDNYLEIVEGSFEYSAGN